MLKNLVIVILIIISIGLAAILIVGRNEKAVVSDNTTTPSETSEMTSEENSASPENKEISKSITLITVDLSGQGLRELPQSVLSNTMVEVLDISNNNLTGALPSEIGKLKALKVLDASNNQMTGVPAEVGQLSNLEVLDLSNNQLKGLPYELGNLKKLKVLNLSGNNYAKQDLEIIKKGLPEDVEIIL